MARRSDRRPRRAPAARGVSQAADAVQAVPAVPRSTAGTAGTAPAASEPPQEARARWTWPERISGLGDKRIGAITPCRDCGQGSWVHYSLDAAFCREHAWDAAMVAQLQVAGVSADDAATVLELVRIFGGAEVIAIQPRECREPLSAAKGDDR